MNSRQTTIDQLTETLRHLRDIAPHLELEVRVTDYANAAYQCRLRLTREGALLDGPEGDQRVERTADPLVIALQIRDSADEARVVHVAHDYAGTYDRPVVVRGGHKVTCRHCNNGCEVCQPTRDRIYKAPSGIDPSRVVVRVGDITPESYGPDSYIVKGQV